jgi:hypothetical protein
VIFLGDVSFVRIFLKNYRVTMTTTLDTSCSENTMVLSARRGFLHARIFKYFTILCFTDHLHSWWSKLIAFIRSVWIHIVWKWISLTLVYDCESTSTFTTKQHSHRIQQSLSKPWNYRHEVILVLHNSVNRRL